MGGGEYQGKYNNRFLQYLNSIGLDGHSQDNNFTNMVKVNVSLHVILSPFTITVAPESLVQGWKTRVHASLSSLINL